jgi:phage terminase large subunit-like protein
MTPRKAVAQRRSWDTSCRDWQARIKAQQSLMPALPLFDLQAVRAVAIFDRLRLPDVVGQPYLRDAVKGWFREIVAAVFGSWDAQARVRHVRELFLLVPKKNIKTTGGAALMVVALLINERPRAEFLFIAPTHEISDLAFAQAVGMIEADDVLRAKCYIQHHIKRITYRPTGAFLKVKSFDPKVVTGTKPCGVLLDELHVIAEAPEADRVIGQLRGGLVSQPEGFLVTITTQSERPPSGVFKAELTKARAVRDGTLIAPLLPILYEFPPDVDWRDPTNWPMVTPNNGASVSVDRLLPDYEAAVAAGEGELRRWASQHLNVEVGVALLSDHWPGALFWSDCTRAGLTLDHLLQASDALAVGIDAGGPEDWMGVAVIGRETGTRHWLVWTHAWVHEGALARYKGEAQKWRDFEADGDLTIVEHIGPDVDQLVAIVAQVYDTGRLLRVGMDPAGSAKVLHEALIADGGIPEDCFVGIGQGWRLVGVMKLIERRLAGKTLWHGGSALMRYCCGNARIEQRGNASLITKAASKGKVDPLLALLDAGECLVTAPVPVDPDAMIAPL